MQTIPWGGRDHTGTPAIEFDGFLHFRSSTSPGSACLMRVRIRASIRSRQSLGALILASVSFAFFFMLVIAFSLMFLLGPAGKSHVWRTAGSDLSPQLTAFFTSAPILASSAALSTFNPKPVAHIPPSSRFAVSMKPSDEYLVLNFVAA